MNIAQSFFMAMRTLGAKKMRSFLTMLGCIIGVAAVVALVSVTEAENKITLEKMKSMGENTIYVNAWEYYWGPPIGRSIGDKLASFIQSDLSAYTSAVTPMGYFNAQRVTFGTMYVEYPNAYAVSEQYSACMDFKISAGRDLSYMDVYTSNRVCVLGNYLAEQLFGYIDPIGKEISISGETFLVIGVYARKDFESKERRYTVDNQIIIPHTTVMKYIDRNLRIETYNIKVKDPLLISRTMKLLGKFLENTIDSDRGWYYVYTNNDSVTEIEETNRSQMVTQAVIAAISLLVGGIGIMNIMLVTVTERTREIGVRKAIGAPRGSIVVQFLIEASVISLTGGFLGIACGIVGTLFYGKVKTRTIVMPQLEIMLIALGVSVALGIIFGIYPAIKASRLQPVDALRNE